MLAGTSAADLTPQRDLGRRSGGHNDGDDVVGDLRAGGSVDVDLRCGGNPEGVDDGAGFSDHAER